MEATTFPVDSPAIEEPLLSRPRNLRLANGRVGYRTSTSVDYGASGFPRQTSIGTVIAGNQLRDKKKSGQAWSGLVKSRKAAQKFQEFRCHFNGASLKGRTTTKTYRTNREGRELEREESGGA